MDAELSDAQVRRKVEQSRAIGYAMGLTDALIATIEQEVEMRKAEA